ncbi:MAG: hypothetical protein ABI175_24275 [Polyangiales bacterium]
MHLSSGVRRFASQGLAIVTLIAVAFTALAFLGALTGAGPCDGDRGSFVCALIAPLDVGLVGVPLSWQAWFLELPPSAPILVLAFDALAAAWIIRPRVMSLDVASRTLALHHRRWPRRTRIHRVRLDDIDVVFVKRWLCFHAVALLDREGHEHDVTSLQLGRWRQDRVVARIEAAIEQAV